MGQLEPWATYLLASNGGPLLSITFKDSPRVEEPNDDVRLWRYMRLERLREVLSTRALYFCRCDLFDDSFEGALSKPAAHHQDRFLSVLRQRGQEQSFAQSAFPRRRMYRKFFFANCWHINDVESLSMWGLYVPGFGIAIETTFANLRASLDTPEKEADAVVQQYLSGVLAEASRLDEPPIF